MSNFAGRLYGFGVEAYLFAAVGYFLFCCPLSRYSQALELGAGIIRTRSH